jgi:hypothetical protein
MTDGQAQSASPDRAGRIAQASAHRRRWARDAVSLRAIDRDAVLDTVVLGTLPDWVGETEPARTALAVLTGAVLRSRRLRRTLEGRVLSAVSRTIGEPRLDAVLCLPGRVRAVQSVPWAPDPVAQLHALGGEVLVRCFDGPASVRSALSRLFPRSEMLEHVAPTALHRVASDALTIWAQHGPVGHAGARR